MGRWDVFPLLMFQDRNSDGTDGDHTGFGEDDLFYPRKTDRASSYDQGSHTMTLLVLWSIKCSRISINFTSQIDHPHLGRVAPLPLPPGTLTPGTNLAHNNVTDKTTVTMMVFLISSHQTAVIELRDHHLDLASNISLNLWIVWTMNISKQQKHPCVACLACDESPLPSFNTMPCECMTHLVRTGKRYRPDPAHTLLVQCRMRSI